MTIDERITTPPFNLHQELDIPSDEIHNNIHEKHNTSLIEDVTKIINDKETTDGNIRL